MQRNKRVLVFAYVVADYLASLLAWFCLYLFRKFIIEGNGFNLFLPFEDSNFYVGLIIVPQIWLLTHYLTGTYTDVYRKSRLQELVRTVFVSLIGTLFIFFLLLLDDKVRKYSDYYLTFFVLYASQFLFTFLGRLLILNSAKYKLENRQVFFNTILIGSNEKANELYEDFSSRKKSLGYNFVGYIALQSDSKNKLTQNLKSLGEINALEKVIDANKIEEVIIAIESNEHHQLNSILNTLADKNVYVRIIPDMYDILSGTVKMNSIIGEAFIEIPPSLLAEWERITKRWFDVLLSILALLLSSPLLVYVAVKIKLSSKGPIFYKQERLGQYGKVFSILKFRSMYTNAEEQGPKLTTDDDPRVTPVGKWIRKYRIDEFPQFLNVIKGEMSLVGPRAERSFFAEKIIALAPHYKHVLKVKPGITSLGMVKYGYASTVEEMVKRLKYDVIYIENMSIVLDFKILIYTVMTVVYGRGK